MRSAVAIAVVFAASFFFCGRIDAQTAPRQIALKNGETVELGPVYWIANCHSIMVGLPEIEILEGPSQATLSIREEPVLPRRQGCANKVPGGILLLTAKGVTDKIEGKLIYRLNYKIKDGPRQLSSTIMLTLFPG